MDKHAGREAVHWHLQKHIVIIVNNLRTCLNGVGYADYTYRMNILFRPQWMSLRLILCFPSHAVIFYRELGFVPLA
jgi:hypothetical protein